MTRLFSFLGLCLCLGLLLGAAPAFANRTIAGNETWSGQVTIKENVTVAPGGCLTIAPGTVLRFAKDTSLTVSGQLVAKGTAKKPIVLRPAKGAAPGSWQGLSLQNAPQEVVLEHLSIAGATQGLAVVGSKLRLSASTIEDCATGIMLASEANAVIKDVTLRRLQQGGIDASVHAVGKVSGCRIDKVQGFAIQTAKQATLMIRDNHISKAKLGIIMNGEFPPMSGNTIEKCEVGIGLIQAGPNCVVRGNTVKDCKIGIGCRQFSSPVLEGNTVTGCDEGIECFQSSSPLIRQNRLAHNKKALACIQMSNPEVARNVIEDNQSGAYLQLSSYARFQQNNFDRNTLHIELDNMSYDWELRATHKPKRSRQAQNAALVKQGRARPESIKVKVESEGFVDARDNYWGEKTTQEMNAKGAAANIAGIADGYDVPTLTYEGWEGEYKKDRVHYDGWKAAPIPGAGPAGLKVQ